MSAPEKPVRVLVIDDEEQIRRGLRSVLGVRKFEVILASNGQEALDLAVDCCPDLVILDLSLPDMDGLEVCRELRNWLNSPILVLSVRSDDADKIAALDLGADDYLTKPFSAGELLARVRALLRRAAPGDLSSPILQVGDITVDVSTRTVVVRGAEVSLTRTEFDILAYLAHNADRVVTSKMLFRDVWGSEFMGPGKYAEDTQTLRVHISRLRKKIEVDPRLPRYIMTEPGVGFCLKSR